MGSLPSLISSYDLRWFIMSAKSRSLSDKSSIFTAAWKDAGKSNDSSRSDLQAEVKIDRKAEAWVSGLTACYRSTGAQTRIVIHAFLSKITRNYLLLIRTQQKYHDVLRLGARHSSLETSISLGESGCVPVTSSVPKDPFLVHPYSSCKLMRPLHVFLRWMIGVNRWCKVFNVLHLWTSA